MDSNQENSDLGLRSSRKKPRMTMLKALRQSHGYSLPDMEKRGLNKYTYSRIEGGYQRASRRMIVAIGDILSIRPYFLFDPYGYAITFSPKDVLVMAMSKRKKFDSNRLKAMMEMVEREKK